MCTALKLEMGPPSALLLQIFCVTFSHVVATMYAEQVEPSEVSVLYKGKER